MMFVLCLMMVKSMDRNSKSKILKMNIKKLLSVINKAKKFFKDSNVRIGIESTGVYSSTILNYFSQFKEIEVIFINPVLTNMFQLSQSVALCKDRCY